MVGGPLMPPPPLPGGPEVGGPPALMAPPPPPPQPERPRPKPTIPAWEPPPEPETVWKDTPPPLDRVLSDARQGKTRWQPRDERITEDYLCYARQNGVTNIDGTSLSMPSGQTGYQRTTPYTFVETVANLAAWTNERVRQRVYPRGDDDEHRDSAQSVEDFYKTSRERDCERWVEQGSTLGIPRMPLAVYESKLMALEGGLAWRFTMNPGDEDDPFPYEPMPWSELYPLGHATTRQQRLSLWEARALYPEINKYYPLEDGEGRAFGQGTEQDVVIICWADNGGYYHAVAWDEQGGGWGRGYPAGTKGGGSAQRWVKKPQRIDYGFPYYNFFVWQGVPSLGTQASRQQLRGLEGAGVITIPRTLFAMLDEVMTILVNKIKEQYNPSTLQTHAEGTDLMQVPPISTLPGARNFGHQGDDVKPLSFPATGGPDGINFMQMISGELADIIPPALKNMASATSGFHALVAGQAAETTIIGPLINALEQMYELHNRQRGLLAYRFGGGTAKGKGQDDDERKYASDRAMFSAYQVNSTSPATKGNATVVKLADFRRAGVRSTVRYKRLNPQEEANQAQTYMALVKEHLMSPSTAMEKLGYDDVQREFEKVLAESSVMDPAVLKTLVGYAITRGGNWELTQAWLFARMLESQQGQGGSPPREAGVASLPAQQAGGANPAPPMPQAPPALPTAAA